MDRFQSMAVFVATVETGSMAAAARALELQPALIGQQIQSLEEQLGTSLFERHGRWQRLTAAGAAYHQQCRSILEMVRGAEASLEATALQPSGSVRVHAPVLFGTRDLAPALATFLRAYPKVQLSLVLDDRAANPADDDFDLVFHRGEALHHPRIECLPLSAQALSMVASPIYLERQGCPERAEELVRHQCLGFLAAGEMGDDQLDDTLQAEASTCWPEDADEDWDGPCNGSEDGFEADADTEAPLAPRVVVQANNALALHALALHGAGIAVLPQALVADDLAAGRLVAVLPGLSLGVEPLGLLLRNDETESPALAALVDWALERFGPQAFCATEADPAVPVVAALAEPDPLPQAQAEPLAAAQAVAGASGCEPACRCQDADAQV